MKKSHSEGATATEKFLAGFFLSRFFGFRLRITIITNVIKYHFYNKPLNFVF